MIVIFLLALLAISVATVAPNVITNAKREKEDEMIWRGKQYIRGIRLYYTKLHKFPTNLEDLYKPKTGIRFMRQAYKDPMNTGDGSWRLIYVGPNGQLIGSLKARTVNIAGQAMPGFGGALGSAPPGTATSSGRFGSSNGFGSASSFGSNNNSSFGSNNSSFGSNNNATAPGGMQQTPTNPADANAMGESTDPQSLQAANLSDGQMFGGNIIGVGSKINQKSVQWYEKAKNYLQFEFVWDPSVDPLSGNRTMMPNNQGNPLGAFGNSATNPNGTSANPNPTNTNQNPAPIPPSSLPPVDPGQSPPLQAPPNP